MIIRRYFIHIAVWMVFITAAFSQCGITSSTPGSTLILSNTSVASNTFSQRIIRIQGSTLFTENVTFVNCEIYLDANFTYQFLNTGSIPKYEFKDCKIFLGGIFRSILNFQPTPVQFVFDGCCIQEKNSDTSLGEILHIEAGGLVFTNNIVNIYDEYHMFHLKNMDLALEHAFYGNQINYTIDNEVLHYEAFILIDQKNGNYKIGDNNRAKNVFNILGTAISNFGGELKGKITIENVEFNTVFAGIKNKSFDFWNELEINNCLFTGNSSTSIGVELNLIKKLSILNCNFKKMPTKAIFLFNGIKDLTINGNTFTENHTAIKSSFAKGDISRNTFTANSIDIHSTGSWSSLDIELNNFSGTQYGILADGDNVYNISNNTFYNSYAGSILYSNGENETGHYVNQFNTIVGVHSLNQNKGYQFMDNCFSSTGGDVYIDGEIMSQVGDETREAGNCFTKQNIPDISATGTSFDYYRPDIKINTCSDPVNLSGFVEKNGNPMQDLDCGSQVPYTGQVYNYCNFNIKKITCDQAKILANQLLIQINFIKNSNTYINAAQKAYLLRRLEICRARLLKFMFGCVEKVPDDPTGDGGGSFVYPQDSIQAGNELKNSANKYESAAFVGLAIELGMLSEASSYLASMPYTDEEMVDFRDVQLINIDYQIQKDSFILSQADQNVLYTIGQKSDPLAAYARGLYHQLTRETIYPTIPKMTFTRSKAGNNVAVSIFPNPLSDLMILTHDNHSYKISIKDISGRVVLTQVMEGGTSTFDTSLWHSGLYIVNLHEHDGHVSSHKVIKQ